LIRETINVAPTTDFTFPHLWQATVVERRPLIMPVRRFIYPRELEEVERGALELIVRPPATTTESGEFLATFALGFDNPTVPTGVWSCPNPDWLCAVAGGYAYLIDTTDPRRWEQVGYRPVLEVKPLLQQQLVLFSGHYSLMAYGPEGKAWESDKLSWEGFKILSVSNDVLTGLGWSLITDREYEFKVDLRTGESIR
jgi:hypothetical protein